MSAITVPVEGRPESETDSTQLLGVDGNAFSVMGNTKRILKRAGASREFTDEYLRQAMDGDYDHLLAVSMAFLDCNGGDANIAHKNVDD